jgi:hypothetical protein
MIKSSLDSFYNYVFKQQDLPKWIVNLNYGSLIGVAACPFVFYGSMFMFDNPKEEDPTFLYFVLLNCYSFFLILITFCSFKIFKLSPIISAILPSLVIIFYIFLIVKATIIG